MKKNNGGRPSTGVERSIKFMLEMSPDEREYLSRKKVALNNSGKKISQNGLIIARVFRRGWQTELVNLRKIQKDHDPALFWMLGKADA